MPHSTPACPQCGLENTYADSPNYICPDCSFEWPQQAATDAGDTPDSDGTIRDSNGNPLADGDAVILIKDLKVKGAGQTLKQGTVIKTIRLTDNPEEIDCRHETIKGLVLRTEFVRKR